tara:strand:+ start:417 stop:893 length:477 start_codon:yes stop_codon:yes gene_type:complete
MIKSKEIEKLILERIQEVDTTLYIVTLNISTSNQINVEIDKEIGNVSISECMSISRNIEHNLDREVVDFSINVSSAGLDKPLRHINQYKKNEGKKIKVKTIDNKEYEGVLIGCNSSEITLQTSKKVRLDKKKKKTLVTEDFNFPFDQIKETKIIISFN